jgi:hypothetical protein
MSSSVAAAFNALVTTYSADLAMWTVVFLWVSEAALEMSQIVQQ